jgi:hypothetical protein
MYIIKEWIEPKLDQRVDRRNRAIWLQFQDFGHEDTESTENSQGMFCLSLLPPRSPGDDRSLHLEFDGRNEDIVILILCVSL